MTSQEVLVQCKAAHPEKEWDTMPDGRVVFSHGGTAIEDPKLSECGRFDIADPQAYYGVSQEIVDLMVSHNGPILNGSIPSNEQ